MTKKPFDPKSTVFTNLMLDIIMPAVPPNAWKILCLAVRKTAGWADSSTYSGRKESDVISVSQFMKGCGIKSDNTVMEAINFCLEKGYLLREPEGQSYRYRINVDYELTTSDIEVVNELTTSKIEGVYGLTPSKIEDTNSKLTNSNNTYNANLQNNLHLSPAEETVMRDSEEIKKSTEDALFRSITSQQTGYAQYPERLRPVVEKMEKLWYFKAPTKAKKGGQYAFWIESCDEILTACGEFGVGLLDELYRDWRAYMETHQGLAPFTVSSPKSLVNSVNGKAALLRSGNKQPMWKLNNIVQSSSRLDI